MRRQLRADAPAFTTPEYRSCTVYHLRRLKVLDGVGIETGKQSSAKEHYASRLTTDALVEKIGRNFWEHVRALNPSKIRRSASSRAQGLRVLQPARAQPRLEPARRCQRAAAAARARRAPLQPQPHPDARRRARARRLRLGRRDGRGRHLEHHQRAEAALQLGYNEISDLPALRLGGLLSLKVLHLQGNELVRVDGVSSLHQLRELVLDRNKIKHLDPGSVRGLMNLRELHLEENGLRTLDHFTPLPKLPTLCLSSTDDRLLDVGELEKLAPLPALVNITVLKNAVARKQLYGPMLIRWLLSLKVIDGREQ